MRKLILLIIIVSTFCAATFTYAGEVIKVTNFKIIKVQSGPSFVQFTLIAKEWDDWVEYPIKSKADANKALNYFSKLDLDKKAVIFIRDGVVIGATSSKFGNFGTPPSNKASSTSESKTYVGKLVGKLIEVDVTGIDDGDTIKVYYKGKNWQVRLIGIDTPEVVPGDKLNHDVEEWNIPVNKVLEMGTEATKYIKSLIKNGDKVRLEFDENSAAVNGEKVDPYNRLLCYVYLKNGTLLNADLLRNGYARFKTRNWKDGIEFPEKKYQAKFQSLEEEAKNRMAGFWKIWSVAYHDNYHQSWTKQLGSSSGDVGVSVAVDTSGNIYVTGYTQGNLYGSTSAGSDDIFLVKYGASGMKQWIRQLGSISSDLGRGVAVDTRGNIYVTGYTQGNLDGNNSAGKSDLFLVKYNSAGTKQWTRQLGTTGQDFAYGVAVDTRGNIYVTGYTQGNLDGNNSAGKSDLFLVKYNSAGTKQWTRQLGTAYIDLGIGVAVDTSGNIYVTGETDGGLDGNTSAGGRDMFLVKYNTSGTKQWTRQLGSMASDPGQGVAVDATGNIYVAGTTAGGNLDGNANAGGADMFLVKYDASGIKQWTRQLGTSNYDIAYGVAVDATGNIYVTGETGGDLDGNTNAGGSKMFLVKYNTLGTKQWTRLGKSSCGQGVAVDTSGNTYVTGSTNGGMDGNTNAGGADMFLVKYDPNGVKQ